MRRGRTISRSTATSTDYASTGYSRWNGFQFELERRYNNGIGFQMFYVTGNTLGCHQAPSAGLNTFLPGAVPTGLRRAEPVPELPARHHYPAAPDPLELGRRPAVRTRQEVRPVTRRASLEKIIGGWQIAGTGNGEATLDACRPTSIPTGIRSKSTASSIRSKTAGAAPASPGILYWNGYIPANQINSVDAQGKPNGVMGVPANYKPAAAAADSMGIHDAAGERSGEHRLRDFWDTNNVWVPLNNSTVQRVTLGNDNLVTSPWRNQYMRASTISGSWTRHCLSPPI